MSLRCAGGSVGAPAALSVVDGSECERRRQLNGPWPSSRVQGPTKPTPSREETIPAPPPSPGANRLRQAAPRPSCMPRKKPIGRIPAPNPRPTTHRSIHQSIRTRWPCHFVQTAFPVHLHDVLAPHAVDSADMPFSRVQLGPFRRQGMW